MRHRVSHGEIRRRNFLAHSNVRDELVFAYLPRHTADALLRPHRLPSSITTAKANRASSSSWTAAVSRASSSAEACRSPTAVKCASIATDAACTSRAASATLARAAASREFEFSAFILPFRIETATRHAFAYR